MLHLLSGVSLVFYIVAGVFLLKEKLTRAGIVFGWLAVISHAISLFLYPQAMITVTIGNSLSVASLALALGLLLIGKSRVKNLGGGVMLTAAFLYLLSAFLVHFSENSSEVSGGSALLWIHIATTLCGIISFLLASFFSLFLLWQDWVFKRKRFLRLIAALPPMRDLAALCGQFLTAGLWLTIIGLGLGFVYAAGLDRKVDLSDPILFSSVCMVCYFGVLLTIRGAQKISEIKFARFCSFGAALIVLSLLAVSQSSSGFHK